MSHTRMVCHKHAIRLPPSQAWCSGSGWIPCRRLCSRGTCPLGKRPPAAPSCRAPPTQEIEEAEPEFNSDCAIDQQPCRPRQPCRPTAKTATRTKVASFCPVPASYRQIVLSRHAVARNGPLRSVSALGFCTRSPRSGRRGSQHRCTYRAEDHEVDSSVAGRWSKGHVLNDVILVLQHVLAIASIVVPHATRLQSAMRTDTDIGRLSKD